VIAEPITKPAKSNQKLLLAKPENITSFEAAPIAMNAKKQAREVTTSGNKRVAKIDSASAEIAATLIFKSSCPVVNSIKRQAIAKQNTIARDTVKFFAKKLL
jgi:hypothetical protein